MSDDTAAKEPVNVAQQLGADPGGSGKDQLRPLTVAGILRDLTQTFPFAMLSVAFLAGAVFAGRQHRR